MAYKIRLADAETYEIPELPVETVITRKGEELKALKFYVPSEITSGGITSIKEVFTDDTKTSFMDFLEDGNSVGREYTDYTLLYNISVSEDDQYIITMVKETNIPSKLVTLEETVADLITQAKTTSATVADINDKIKDVDINELTIDELKAYQIAQSKANLAEYLENNSVKSTAHQGVEKEYSITSEKQGYLMSMVMMCQAIEQIRVQMICTAYTTMVENVETTEATETVEDGETTETETVSYDEFKEKVLSGEIELALPTFQPSWNARGEECTYDWTLEELVVLGADIEAKVRPLVSLQQSMESQIMAATSRDEILEVVITFDNVDSEE